MEVVGSLICIKIPMGSPRAAHSVAQVQPMGSEVGSSPVFSVWVVAPTNHPSSVRNRCVIEAYGGVFGSHFAFFWNFLLV